MRETLSGPGKLLSRHAITGAVTGETDVHFEIHFNTSLRTVRSGFPPVQETKATVSFVNATDGRHIPDGIYELRAEGEHLRLKHIPGAGWFVLSQIGG